MWVMWSRQRPWWCHVHPEPSSRCPYHHHFVSKQWLPDKYQCQQVWCCCATSDAIVPLQICNWKETSVIILLTLAFSSSQPLLFVLNLPPRCVVCAVDFLQKHRLHACNTSHKLLQWTLPWKIQHHFYQIQLLNSIYLTFWLVLDVVRVHNHQDLISNLLPGRTSSTHSGESPTNPKPTAGGRLP